MTVRSCIRSDGKSKKKYLNRFSAKTAIVRMYSGKQGDGHSEYSAYECPKCEYWHVGRQPSDLLVKLEEVLGPADLDMLEEAMEFFK